MPTQTAQVFVRPPHELEGECGPLPCKLPTELEPERLATRAHHAHAAEGECGPLPCLIPTNAIKVSSRPLHLDVNPARMANVGHSPANCPPGQLESVHATGEFPKEAMAELSPKVTSPDHSKGENDPPNSPHPVTPCSLCACLQRRGNLSPFRSV